MLFLAYCDGIGPIRVRTLGIVPMAFEFDRRIRIMVADRDAFTLQMYRLIFQAYDTFDLVAVAETGIELLRLCQRQQPDVVLIDLGLPHFNGIKAARFLRMLYPWLTIIGIARGTVHEETRQQFMQAGANRCLSSIGSIHDLIDTVYDAYR
ncbi:MAG: hypothetical protein CL607_02130 [Anaerolineaceae bacterium]|nr:hypothetical protein [Anaerolineaceae bacterium]